MYASTAAGYAQSWLQLSRRIVAPFALLLLALLGACGGGGGGSAGMPTAQSCSGANCGTAVLTITDAPGSFLAYQVTLVSLQLQRADGGSVETLALSTKVDVAKLVSLTEVLGTTQIPPGEYSGATVTLDYTGANIVVDDGSTNGLALAPVDSNGNVLGQLTLAVQLDAKHRLEISAGHLARLSFDFNLLASNSVDTSKKTVTVSPVLVASVVPPDSKDMRVRGTTVAFDTTTIGDNSFTIDLHPFDDDGPADKGQLVVHVTDATAYEVNGTPSIGATGLGQLATLGTGTLTVAYGSLSAGGDVFTATRVLAGTSVRNPNLDHVSGSVVARSGNSLTVHGGDLEDHGAPDEFVPGDITVTIGDGTDVTAAGQSPTDPAHTIADISVGSRIDAFGAGSKDGSGHMTIDAAKGHVRLEPTLIAGTVVGTGSGTLTLNLRSINGRDPGLYQFAGTGSPTGHDSDPAKYVVDTGSLDLTPFSVNGPTVLIGWVAQFGSAPPDFSARMPVHIFPPPLPMGAELAIGWGDLGTMAPFQAFDVTHIVLDTSNTAIVYYNVVQTIEVSRLLEPPPVNPTIVPNQVAMTTAFSIVHAASGTIDNYQGFADFYAKLSAKLPPTGKAAARRLFAGGQYDMGTNTFTAMHVAVVLND